MYSDVPQKKWQSVCLSLMVVMGCFWYAADANAKTCGGSVSCSCGDTVRGTYEMTSDLSRCPHTGLFMGSNAVLDCAGHTIASGGSSYDEYGIYFLGTSGATARNCTIRDFGRGIVLKSARGNTIEKTTITGSILYGLYEAQSSSKNTVSENIFTENKNEAIRIASGAGDGDIYTGNTIRANPKEAVYILEGRGGTFRDNNIESVTSYALYMQDAHHWTFSGNRFTRAGVIVTGSSNRNTFVDNIFTNARVRFEPYTKDRNARVPFSNTIEGGEMRNPGACYEMDGAPKNTVERIAVLECNTPFEVTFDDEKKGPEFTAWKGWIGAIADKISRGGGGVGMWVGSVVTRMGNAIGEIASEVSYAGWSAVQGVKHAFTYVAGIPSRVLSAPTEVATKGGSYIGTKLKNWGSGLLHAPVQIGREFVYAGSYIAHAPAALYRYITHSQLARQFQRGLGVIGGVAHNDEPSPVSTSSGVGAGNGPEENPPVVVEPPKPNRPPISLPCGARITTDTILEKDISGCRDVGVIIAGPVTLDCDSFGISGVNGQIGISFENVSNAVVRNCVVEGFLEGAVMRGGSDNIVSDTRFLRNGNVLTHAGQGMRIDGAEHVTLLGNTFAENYGDGLQMTDVRQGVFRGNEFFGNNSENILLLNSTENTLEENSSEGAGEHALYMKNTKNNTLTGNLYEGQVLLGNISTENIFSGEVIMGARLIITESDRNTFSGGSIDGGLGTTCIQFKNAANNIIRDTVLSRCVPDSVLSEGVSFSGGNSNTLHRVTLPEGGRMSERSGSRLIVEN